MKEKSETIILIFNEAMVSLYLYFVILLTDFNDSPIAINVAANVLVIIVEVSFVVNLLKVAYFMINQMRLSLKRKYMVWKGQK